MKAEDAIINRAVENVIKRWEDPPQESTDSQYWEFEREIYGEIAEISFRAGIREVVEWIEKASEYKQLPNIDHTFYYHLDVLDSVWQAKLKDWGANET